MSELSKLRQKLCPNCIYDKFELYLDTRGQLVRIECGSCMAELKLKGGE